MSNIVYKILNQYSLSKSRLFCGYITPFLDNRLLYLSWVGSGSGADLLGNINTLLSGTKLGDKLGNMSTGSLGLKATFFLGGILDNGAGLIIANFSSLLESTASRSTHLSGFFGTSSNGSVLLDIFLRHTANF